MTLLAAIHGILTSQTDPSWPDRLDAWMAQHAPGIKVLKKEYRAGPFPRLNCWLKDPLLALSLANELELFLQSSSNSSADCESAVSPTASRRSGHNPQPSLWLVAHSNGAIIALDTARLLIERGHRITGLLLIGAAVDPDLERNGIGPWLSSQLGCAIAFISPEDHLLPPAPASQRNWQNWLGRLWAKLIYPYGNLGRVGWQQNGKPAAPNPALLTRTFHGGHSGYFEPQQREKTFAQILSDIRTYGRKMGVKNNPRLGQSLAVSQP